MKRGERQQGREQQGQARRVVIFAIVEGLFIISVVVPVLLYLFVHDTGLSEAQQLSYVIQLLILQAVVTGLLLWKLRIIPAPRTDRKDAR
jgi:hypothetical protein